MVHIHLLQFKSRFRNANIVNELATWKINVSILNLAIIVESTIILQTYVPNARNLQEKRTIMGGSLLGDGHQQL
jgi:hypothetical protein